MPTAAAATTSIRYDGETYALAGAVDLGSIIREARRSSAAAGPNTPALAELPLASGGVLTIEVGAGTPVTMIVESAKAPARAAAPKTR